MQSISNFDYGSKQIDTIYCNAFQPLVTGEGFECAETTLYFAKRDGMILEEKLLLDPPGLESSEDTHWKIDLHNMINKMSE